MSNEQLERDLYKQIRAKYQRWINDSLELYEMADVPVEEAFVAVTHIVIRSLVSVLTKLDVPPEKVAQEIYNELRAAREERRQRRHQTSQDKD